ncbi:unnamed protein product, partial [Gulo gulo]
GPLLSAPSSIAQDSDSESPGALRRVWWLLTEEAELLSQRGCHSSFTHSSLRPRLPGAQMAWRPVDTTTHGMGSPPRTACAAGTGPPPSLALESAVEGK